MKIRALTKVLQEKAEKELNEVPNQLEEHLQNFKSWLAKQEHIKYKDDDQLLVNFLRGSKFSLQQAKEKIDAYYCFRTIAPEIALNFDPFQPNLQSFLKGGLCVPLSTPNEDPASPRVCLLRYQGYDPDEISLTTILKAGLMNLTILFNIDDHLVISGTIVIWDLKGIHYKTALQATPDLIKKTIYCNETAFPTRIKAVYILNVPKYFEAVLNVAKNLLSEKLAKRLHFYSTNNYEEIYKNVPKSILPEEYGGDAGPHAALAAEWKKVVESHREWLLNENNYYTCESKRPVEENFLKSKSLYGVDGSFKKLDIDKCHI